MQQSELDRNASQRHEALLMCRAQRAVSDAYGIIVNVITSDQHNWCARCARAHARSPRANMSSLVHKA